MTTTSTSASPSPSTQPHSIRSSILQIKDYSSKSKSRSPSCSNLALTTPSIKDDSSTFNSSSNPTTPSTSLIGSDELDLAGPTEGGSTSNTNTLRGRPSGMVGGFQGKDGEELTGKNVGLIGIENQMTGLGIRMEELRPSPINSREDSSFVSSDAMEDSVGQPSSFPPDPPSLQGLPLPVRLGLIAPPVPTKRLSKQIPKHPLSSRPTPRFNNGYYFCIAPPFQPPSPFPNSISSPTTPNPNFTFFPASPPLFKINYNPTTPLLSDTASIATSNSSNSDGNYHSSHLPRSQSAPWNPSQYFRTSKERVRGKSRESKRHAYPSNEVPYFFGYDSESLNADALVHSMLREHLVQDFTLTKFPMDYLPSRVLDLGTGQGSWCIDAARDWTSTEFIGLDVVPIQTPLASLNEPDLEQRVSWVVANFLEPLPFPDDSFDLIHMRFIGTGIPDDRWPDVLAEATRVLIQGGTLEIVDTNFTFFGTPNEMDSKTLEEMTEGKFSTIQRREASEDFRNDKLVNENDPNYALQILMERMWSRRSIDRASLTVIPATLILQDLDSIAISDPRHIPITTNPSGLSAPREGAPPLLNDPLLSDDIFHFLTQYAPTSSELPSWIELTSDIIRATWIIHQAKTLSSARDWIWEEAEQEKVQELNKISDLSRSPTQNQNQHQNRNLFQTMDNSSSKPFIHPFTSQREFNQVLDTWESKLIERADLSSLLKSLLEWKDGESSKEFNVDERKAGERRRKLSVSTRNTFGSGSDHSSRDSNVHPSTHLRRVMNQIQDEDYELEEEDYFDDVSSPGTLDSVSTKPSSRNTSRERVSLLGIKDIGVWTARGN